MLRIRHPSIKRFRPSLFLTNYHFSSLLGARNIARKAGHQSKCGLRSDENLTFLAIQILLNKNISNKSWVQQHLKVLQTNNFFMGHSFFCKVAKFWVPSRALTLNNKYDILELFISKYLRCCWHIYFLNVWESKLIFMPIWDRWCHKTSKIYLQRQNLKSSKFDGHSSSNCQR